MDALELVRIHLTLECIGIDGAGQLFRIPGPDPDTLHRVYVARHERGDSLFFQADLPYPIRRELQKLPISAFFEATDQVKAILAKDRPCEEIHIGKSYIFPGPLRSRLYPDVVRLADLDPDLVRWYDPGLDLSHKEVFGVVVDGQIVSTCESSRENETAGQAWVRTLEGYRRRGYARQVTAAWGNWLLSQGRLPFYSHRWDNFASQAVAQSLGLVQYIADAGYA